MLRFSSLLLGLFSLLYYSSCTQNQDIPFGAQIMDAIHLPTIHQDFIAADRAKWQQDFPKAIKRFKLLLDSKSQRTEKEQCYLLNQLAYCYLQIDQEARALPFLRLAKTVCQESEADYWLNEGLHLLAVDSGAQAIHPLRKADQLYQKQYGEQHLRRLQNWTALGKAYLHYSIHTDSAEIFINRALALSETDTLLRPYAAGAYLEKANLLRENRIYMDGLSYVNLALAHAQSAPFFDTMFMGNCHSVKGHILKKLRWKEAAQAQHLEAVRLGEERRGDQKSLKVFYEKLLTTYLSKSDSASFFYYLNQLEKKFHHFPKAFQHPDCLRAYYYYKTKNYEKSKSIYYALMEQYQDSKGANKNFFGEAYFVLGDMHRIQGDFKKAMYFSYELIKLKFGEAYIPKSIQEINWTLFEQLEANRKSILLIYYSKIPNNYLRQFEADSSQVEQLFKAVEWYALVDQLFFEHSEEIDENSLLTFAYEHFQTTYTQALNACYQAYQLNPNPRYLQIAHQILERTKYTLLFRDMLEGETVFSNTASAEIIEEERRISQMLKELEQKKIQSPEQLDIADEYQTIQLLSKQRQLYKQLKKEHQEYFFRRIQQNVASLGELQQLLGQRQEAAIQYHISTDAISIFVIQSDTVVFKQVKRPPQLERLLKKYRELLHNPDRAYTPSTYSQFCQVSHELYQLFIAPIYPYLTAYQKLVICPDVNTQLFPFEALLSQPIEDKDGDYRQLLYLLRDFELTYVYSMKNYWYKQRAAKLLSKTPRILAYAFSQQQKVAPIAGLFRGKALVEIEGTAMELDAIKSSYPQGDHHFRYGTQSTRADFLKQRDQEYDIIHLAVHAFSDTSNRYSCNICFQNTEKKYCEEVLYGYEVEQLNLQTPLVVLSACRTAVGEVLQAEGSFSLARSFIVAGAQKVISSLWDVDDQETKKLMQAFYDVLQSEKPPSTGLHLAKSAYLQQANKYTAYPGYWAAFILLE